MRLAKQFGEDSNSCASRQIGAIVVDPVENKITGMGYNGPAKGIDFDEGYIKSVFLKDKKLRDLNLNLEHLCREILHNKKCPRKLLYYESGNNLELCACVHAEMNAILNRIQGSLCGHYMFCWCPVPCPQCCAAIINVGISRIFCLDGSYQNDHSFWMLNKAKIIVDCFSKDFFL